MTIIACKSSQRNSETKMDKILEGNEIGDVEIEEIVKEKKKVLQVRTNKAKTLTSVERRLEKRYGIDHRKE